jgi:hypothetical protein
MTDAANKNRWEQIVWLGCNAGINFMNKDPVSPDKILKEIFGD